MSQSLQSSLKNLKAAVTKLNYELTTNVLEKLTSLLKSVKPGHALDAKVAHSLVCFFNDDINELYRALPKVTIKFSTAYFTELLRHFKVSEGRWQYVGGRGILTGLTLYMQEYDDADIAASFDKTLVAALCQLLKGDTSPKGLSLTPDFRRVVGAFLAEVLSKHQQAKKWLVEPKILGMYVSNGDVRLGLHDFYSTGLSDLILKETEFRVLDTCLEIATRLAPKRSDPQARRAFFTDIFNSTSAKARFGDETCKRLMKIMELPQKGGTWFEISDQMFAEMDGNSDRLHRFVLQHLMICERIFSESNTLLRMYLDTGITFNGFRLEEDEEVMMTTSYDNLMEVRIDYTGGSASAKLVLSLPPTWENPDGTSSQKASQLVTLQLPITEMTRFQNALKLHGQATKIFDTSKAPKQSFSNHPTKLGLSDPPASTDAQVIKLMEQFIDLSPTPSLENATYVPQDTLNAATAEDHAESGIPMSTKRKTQEPGLQPQVAHQVPNAGRGDGLKRENEVRVHRGVVLDSQDQAPYDSTYKSKFLKRKSSELTELDDVVSSPARKKTRVEEDKAKEKAKLTKPVLPKASRKPLAKDISAQINKETQVQKHGESKNIPEFSNALQSNLSRINQMKPKDGKRPATASTPRRRPQPAKTQAPRSIQEPSQTFIRDIDQNAVSKVVPPASKNAKKEDRKSQKAIWEAEDFSQKAALVFPSLVHAKKSLAGSCEDAITDDLDEKETHVSQEQNDCAVQEEFLVENTGTDDEASIEGGPEDEESAANDIDEGNGSISDGTEEDEAAHNSDSEAEEEDAVEEDPKITSPPDQVVHQAAASPVGLNQRIQMPPQELHPSSPIRPAMILKRKLLDNALLQRDVKVQEPSAPSFIATVQPKGTGFNQEQGWPFAQHYHSPHKKTDAGADQYVVRLSHSFLARNDSYKKRPAPEWVIPIKPPHVGPTQEARPQRIVEKPKVSRGPKAVTKVDDKKKALRYKPAPPISTTDEDSDSEMEQGGVSTSPKSEVDGIAEVLTAIQNTLLNKINGKFTGVRREARLARANLLENAVVDLGVMQENHEKSLARFMKLEEKCGEATQQIIGGLEELQFANKSVINNLKSIIREHDEVTAATKAARKPLFPKLPMCLELEK